MQWNRDTRKFFHESILILMVDIVYISKLIDIFGL